VFVAGEACGVGGAEKALVEGAIAGIAAAATTPPTIPTRLAHRRASLRQFAGAVAHAYPVPTFWSDNVTDDTLICRCEEVTEGNHNLQYGGTASYIRVFGPRSGGNWGSGWNGGGQRGVVLYEDANSTGRSQEFGVGRYLNMTGALGNVRNDKASSVVVQRGFRVRLCEDEGNMGIGAGRCEEYGEGRYNLRYNDSASYIEVARAGWGGGWNGGGWSGGGNDGGWNGNNGGSNGGWNGNNNGNSGGWGGNRDRGVMVYIDPDQRGTGQLFDVGTFRNDQGLMSQIGNDTASSVWVANGYHVQLCENEPKGFYGNSGTGKCEEYGPGRYNLRYNDKASYIRVWRDR